MSTQARFDLGRLGVWGHLDSMSIDAAREYARRVDELGFGTLWVPETVGREPFTLLGLIAAETSEAKLGTSIVGIWGHDAQTTRMAALTLAEATAGRFVLGLGVSHPHLAEKLRGHAFDRPAARMREFIAAYRSAVYKGPMPEGWAEPPVLVAALREQMLGIAGSDADGAFPYLVTPERLAWMRPIVDAAAQDAGASARPVLAVTMPAVVEADPDAAHQAARAYLGPYLRTPAYQASWLAQGFEPGDWEKPASDRLVDAMVAWGGVERVRERIAAFVDAGADHVAVIPLSPEGVTEHLPVLEALAAD
jgi:probable F420-dependent oxidoreductase